jgi:hypothetical protein
MQPLNLPPFEYNFKIKQEKQYIFDIIRKKYILNTPEEWVRQHFINFLISHRNYSKNLIKIESGLKYLKRKKRTDIQVYDNNGTVFMIIECKAPDVVLDKQVITQILQYHKVLQAQLLAITNGIDHYFCKINDKREIEYLNDLPMQNHII